MAGQAGILDSAEQRARWGNFQWTDANAKAAKEIIARYPPAPMKSASRCRPHQRHCPRCGR